MKYSLVKLGHYASVQGGFAYKSSDFLEFSENKVLKIKNVRAGVIDYTDTGYISNQHARETIAWKLKEGDILISMTGSGPNAPQSLVGRVARVWEGDEEAWFNQRVGRIRVHQERVIHPDFIFYWLSLPQSQQYLVANSSGSANQANISGKVIESLPIPKLDYLTSKKISKILKKFDKKIISNIKINQTLESIAQAVFKSWFINFEPVNAKITVLKEGGSEEEALFAAMQVISSKSIEELQQLEKEKPNEYKKLQQIAMLFPNSTIDSDIGQIPEGWDALPFGECLTRTIGGDWGKEQPDEKHTAKVRIIRGTDLPKVYIGEDDSVPVRYVEPKKLKTRQLQAGDIVLEVSGGSKNQPTGRSLFFSETLIKRLGVCEPASFCRLFRPNSVELGLILGLHLQIIYSEGKTWQYQNQSTGISNFQTKIFLEHELVVVPSEELLGKFFDVVMPLINKMHDNENQILRELRDSLLPKLLSGEVSERRAVHNE